MDRAFESDERCSMDDEVHRAGVVGHRSMTVRRSISGITDRADAAVEEVLDYLDSPSGRRLRHAVATGLIVGAPLVMRMPGLRRTPAGRLVELVGGAALVVRAAEMIRDWERSSDSSQAPV
jgi:hypothetical protein